MRRAVAQTIDIDVIDGATGQPKTGDAANLTLYVSKDDGTLTALADTSATEVSATNAKGTYRRPIVSSSARRSIRKT
jgi:hypothetical protein